VGTLGKLRNTFAATSAFGNILMSYFQLL